MNELDLTGEQRALRQAVREFALKEVTPDLIAACEAERRPPLEPFFKLADQGWLAVGIPSEFGGSSDYVSLALMLEALAYQYVPLADLVYRALIHGASTIAAYGSDLMKSEWMPAIARGRLLFMNAISEPDVGADAASVQTRAVRDGDDYVITGNKIFNTGMQFVDYAICYARTDPAAEKHHGITAIVVPVPSEGLTIRPMNTVGYKSTVTCQVSYDEVRVPAKNVLGQIDGGWEVMTGHLQKERLAMSSICVGAGQRALDDAIGYANTREQFGRPIGQFQVIQHMTADMCISVHTSRLLMYELADMAQKGATGRLECAIAKVYCAEMYKSVADQALQIWGAYGYIEDSDVNRHWRDSRLHTIGGGSVQIQRNIIARQLGVGRPQPLGGSQ